MFIVFFYTSETTFTELFTTRQTERIRNGKGAQETSTTSLGPLVHIFYYFIQLTMFLDKLQHLLPPPPTPTTNTNHQHHIPTPHTNYRPHQHITDDQV